MKKLVKYHKVSKYYDQTVVTIFHEYITPSYFRSLVAVSFRFTVLYKVNLSHTLLIINGRNSVFGQENKWQICDYLKKINFSCRKFFQLHLDFLLQTWWLTWKQGNQSQHPYSFLPLGTAHKYSDVSLQFSNLDGFLIFLILMAVITRLLLHDYLSTFGS